MKTQTADRVSTFSPIRKWCETTLLVIPFVQPICSERLSRLVLMPPPMLVIGCMTFSLCHWSVVVKNLHSALCNCLSSSRGLGSGRREKGKEKNEWGWRGCVGGKRTHLKKRREREEQNQRGREKGEGGKKVTSSWAASEHGAREKLWESKQCSKIPICVQPLCSPCRRL